MSQPNALSTQRPTFWVVVVSVGLSFAALAIAVVAISVGLSATSSAAKTAQAQADAAKADADSLRRQVDAAITARNRQVAAQDAKVSATANALAERTRVDTCLVLNSQTLTHDPSIGNLRADLHCGPSK